MDARRLVLMRHATAESFGERDAQRHLAVRGRTEAERVGQRLVGLDLRPDRVLCSSATRCRETWEHVSRPFASTVPLDVLDALYHADADALRDAIAGVDAAGTLLVLAHNPGISALAVELADPASTVAVPLRGGLVPAAIAVFRIDGSWSTISRRTARLERTERPEEA